MATRTFTAEQRAASDAARREMVEQLHQQLAERISRLGNGDEWQRWLSFASSFHRYSFNNTLLIWVQRPDATLVAGYRAWQAKGRQVRRGETAIRVLGPVTRREPKTDLNGRPILDAEGKPMHELRIIGVKPVPVFELAQTDGDPLLARPEVRLLTGQAPPGLWEAVQGVIEAEGFAVQRGDCGGANGLTLFDQRVVRVRSDVDDAQSVKSLIHEAAHVLMHADPATSTGACRGVKEVESESVAYVVTRAHGLDSSQYTFNYVAGWAAQAAGDASGIDAIVAATGTRVIAAADRILRHTRTGPAPEAELLDALAEQTLTPAPASPVGRWETVTASPRLGPAADHVPGFTPQPQHRRGPSW